VITNLENIFLQWVQFMIWWGLPRSSCLSNRLICLICGCQLQLNNYNVFKG